VNRRRFLQMAGGTLVAAGAPAALALAPAVVKAANLMPLRLSPWRLDSSGLILPEGLPHALNDGEMREVMQYTIHDDLFHLRWDTMIGGQQVHVDAQIVAPECGPAECAAPRVCVGPNMGPASMRLTVPVMANLKQARKIARAALLNYARHSGL
jgi:hypothetical protein